MASRSACTQLLFCFHRCVTKRPSLAERLCAIGHLSYVEAILVGALQGVTELFPVSSLGHSILLPALAGGQWAQDLNVSAPESPYLAVIVGLHVVIAGALLLFFWRDWLRIVAGFATSLRHRRIDTPAERMAWLIVLATIPVGLSGLALEHLFRTTLGRPIPAAVFLIVNGVILYGGERLRRRSPTHGGNVENDAAAATTAENMPEEDGVDADRRLAGMSLC